MAEPGCTKVPANPIADNARYTMVAHLNRGRHGFVIKALDKLTGEPVAIKFLDRLAATNKYVEREIINQYKLLCHPHIIGILDIFLTPRYLALVLEYANLGDLHTYVMSRRGLDEPQARWFFQQLMLALDFCHRKGVANRDIKLENTLLSGNGRPLLKLADFGFSKDEQEGHSAPTTRVGTIMYMAPEVIRNPGRGSQYDGKKADVWSCGVVLYAMLSGKYPFKRPEDAELGKVQGMRAVMNRIMQGEYPPLDVTPQCMDLLDKLLEQDPAERLAVRDIMQHPWFIQGLSPAVLTYNDDVVAATATYNEAQDETLARMHSVLSELLSCARKPTDQ